MTKPKSLRKLDAARMMLAGAGTISFDQQIRVPRVKSARDALAGDWEAVGGDLRRAMKRVGA